jgi:hypothetical protein
MAMDGFEVGIRLILINAFVSEIRHVSCISLVHLVKVKGFRQFLGETDSFLNRNESFCG